MDRSLSAGSVNFSQGDQILFENLGFDLAPNSPETWFIVYQSENTPIDGTRWSIQLGDSDSVDVSLHSIPGQPLAVAGAYPIVSDIFEIGFISSSADYMDWSLEVFGELSGNPAISGPFEDADGDGYFNWEEYAFGSHPMRRDSIPELTIAAHRILEGEAHWRLTYQRRAQASQFLNIQLESSPSISLPEWNRVLDAGGVVDIDNESSLETVQHELVIREDAFQLFFRLRALWEAP